MLGFYKRIKLLKRTLVNSFVEEARGQEEGGRGQEEAKEQKVGSRV